MILYGPPGVGNTRIAQALGEPGLPHRALHLVTHHETVQKAAQRPVPTGTREKTLQKLLKPDLLRRLRPDCPHHGTGRRAVRDHLRTPPAGLDHRHLEPHRATGCHSSQTRFWPTRPWLAHRAHHVAMKGESYRKKRRPETPSPDNRLASPKKAEVEITLAPQVANRGS